MAQSSLVEDRQCEALVTIVTVDETILRNKIFGIQKCLQFTGCFWMYGES